MRRRLVTSLCFFSLLICVLIAAIGTRSLFVMDTISWTNTTEHPLTDAARAWAQRKGYAIGFLARSRAFSVTVTRGMVMWSDALSVNVLSSWEPSYYEAYVNRPQWSHQSHRPAPPLNSLAATPIMSAR